MNIFAAIGLILILAVVGLLILRAHAGASNIGGSNSREGVGTTGPFGPNSDGGDGGGGD